jgi:hypothetical protein
MRALYAGSDLHGNNNLIGILDEQGRRIFKKRLPNDPQLIRDVFKPYKSGEAMHQWTTKPDRCPP